MQAATNEKIMITMKILAVVKKNVPMIPIVVSAIIATPVAKPSKPSIKFTAFVIAKIQSQVIGKLSQPKWKLPMIGNTIKFILILPKK